VFRRSLAQHLHPWKRAENTANYFRIFRKRWRIFFRLPRKSREKEKERNSAVRRKIGIPVIFPDFSRFSVNFRFPWIFPVFQVA
jgi:hypothetical protein